MGVVNASENEMYLGDRIAIKCESIQLHTQFVNIQFDNQLVCSFHMHIICTAHIYTVDNANQLKHTFLI